MDIVLASAPHTENSWNSESFPPLGLLYVAGGLKDFDNVQVKIVDCFGENLNVKQSAERILAISPDILGLNVTSRNIDEARQLLAEVKTHQPSLITVAGGIHPTLFDVIMLKEIDDLDFIIRGEGDESFGALCGRLMANQSFSDVQGVSYRSNGKIISNQPAVVADLDSLPFPDRSLLEFEGYATQWYGYEIPNLPRIATAVSSRGCPYECLFCSDTKFCGRRYKTRSAGNVLEELKLLFGQGYETVIFWDDNLVIDMNRTEKLCNLILESKLNLRMACAGTFHMVPQRLMDLMHEAGFDLVFIGVESGSPEQLVRYKKPTNRQAMADSIQRMKKANMVTIASFINGAPGETEEDFNNTKDFVREVRPHIAEINPLMVHPGSGIWDQLNPPETITKLADTHSAPIWRYPDQHDRETAHRRAREFRLTFKQKLLNWRSIIDVIALLIHNPLVRTAAARILARPGGLLKFIKGLNPR